MLVNQASELSRHIYLSRAEYSAFVGRQHVGGLSNALGVSLLRTSPKLVLSTLRKMLNLFVDVQNISINSSQLKQYTLDKFLTSLCC
jgi:hypothetical protein